MRHRFALVLAFVPFAAQAALPLQPGEIDGAGYKYVGEPDGACDRFCDVDSTMTTVTPIAALPPGTSPIKDLVVEGPGRVVLLGASGFAPTLGTLLQLDVVGGMVNTIASGFAVAPDPTLASAKGRLFVTGPDGLREIDRMTGAVTLVAADARGVDAEPGGASLVTSRLIPGGCFPMFGDCTEFVRIDVATGSQTTVAPVFNDYVSEIDARPDGSRFLFSSGGQFFDGFFAIVGPSGADYIFGVGGEDYQASAFGIASDLDGMLLIGGDGHPDSPNAILELQRRDVDATLLDSLDADFGISAVDVTPLRLCSNGYDDDGDGLVDWDGGGIGAPDAGCAGNPMRNDERPTTGGCGLGAELVLLFAALRALGRRRS
jgi:hypothetical protein